MDIRLRGERDGIETATEIRDRFRLPVVFMSAHTDEATLGRARRSSPYGYVVKPFTLGELWTAIEIALERHALETKLREGRTLVPDHLAFDWRRHPVHRRRWPRDLHEPAGGKAAGLALR